MSVPRGLCSTDQDPGIFANQEFHQRYPFAPYETRTESFAGAFPVYIAMYGSSDNVRVLVMAQ